MSVLATYIVPHPPIILPEIGRGEEKKIQTTIDAYQTIAREIADFEPDTIVIATPHGRVMRERFLVPVGSSARGDFAMFGAYNVALSAPYDEAFANALVESSGRLAERKRTIRKVDLDHGSLVPLYFLEKELDDFQLVLVAPSALPLEKHHTFGQRIQETADKEKRRIVFLASGDLSHRLKEEGPYGYAEEGPRFDEKIVEIIEANDPGQFLALDRAFVERAGECGLRPFSIMAGVLAAGRFEAKLHSYEGPFGVGYAVAGFTPKKGRKPSPKDGLHEMV